mmetsp:Transcript_62473/g.116072  ORF Transcript_62473/g.116072 Transcript_62473/m.116072 type:complete len:236 (-) Transcript_62473:346-1053(-)
MRSCSGSWLPTGPNGARRHCKQCWWRACRQLQKSTSVRVEWEQLSHLSSVYNSWWQPPREARALLQTHCQTTFVMCVRCARLPLGLRSVPQWWNLMCDLLHASCFRPAQACQKALRAAKCTMRMQPARLPRTPPEAGLEQAVQRCCGAWTPQGVATALPTLRLASSCNGHPPPMWMMRRVQPSALKRALPKVPRTELGVDRYCSSMQAAKPLEILSVGRPSSALLQKRRLGCWTS